jgi:threonine dehydrogenase-like Zn-dependent dehydrogenase
MMKAVWTGREQIEIRTDRNGPPTVAEDDQVRIRIRAAGVCGTDVHIWEGRLSFTDPPLVLGHEFTGVVDGCGSGVRGFHPGDRVKCDSVVGCGACEWCRSGATQFCPRGSEFGITRDGGWAEWLVAPQRNLHKLPDAVPDEVAAIMDVEVLNALGKAGIRPGETVAVFGAGPAGLIALQFAHILGAGTVVLCGRRRERLELGRQLGAERVIDLATTDVVETVRAVTGGLGADVVFDAAGTEQAILDAFRVLRPQGRAVLYGVPDRAIPEFPVKDLVLKDVVVYGALPNRTGWEEMIELVSSGRLDLQRLITHRFPLERAGEALRAMRDRKDGAIKAVLQIPT